MRIVVFCLVGLVLLVALLLVGENWRGKWAWTKLKRQLEAKGEPLDKAALMPTPVPPEQNFAMTPLLAPLFDYDRTSPNGAQWRDTNALARIHGGNALSLYPDGRSGKAPPLGSWRIARPTDLAAWQQYFRHLTHFPVAPQPQSPAADVLLALTKYEAELSELEAASQRPHAQFPLHWDEDFDMLLPHLAVFKNITRTLQLRACAALAAGNPERALKDVKLMLRMIDTLKHEPVIISHLVRIAMFEFSLQPVWEGLAERRWPDSSLAALEDELRALDFVAGQIYVFRGERAFVNSVIDRMAASGKERANALKSVANLDDQALQVARFIPAGLLRRNQVTINRFYQQSIDSLQSLRAETGVYHPLDRGWIDDCERALARRTPYNALASLLLPSVFKCVDKSRQAQSAADLARVACALERCRLARGAFPASLDALPPAWIDRVPQDITTGEPLRYRPTADGQFKLYSVGQNEMDDGGVVFFGETRTRADLADGDWVWTYRQH